MYPYCKEEVLQPFLYYLLECDASRRMFSNEGGSQSQPWWEHWRTGHLDHY